MRQSGDFTKHNGTGYKSIYGKEFDAYIVNRLVKIFSIIFDIDEKFELKHFKPRLFRWLTLFLFGSTHRWVFNTFYVGKV